jgi:hypothetical protein
MFQTKFVDWLINKNKRSQLNFGSFIEAACFYLTASQSGNYFGKYLKERYKVAVLYLPLKCFSEHCLNFIPFKAFYRILTQFCIRS